MAAPTYGFKSDELEAKLSENNPIERVGVLAKAKVPVFIIRGDGDKVVPLKENSAELAARYEAAGAKDAVTLVVAKGQGHNFWEGFFRCPELVQFAIAWGRGSMILDVDMNAFYASVQERDDPRHLPELQH
jgi:acetyl esterase/lipase